MPWPCKPQNMLPLWVELHSLQKCWNPNPVPVNRTLFGNRVLAEDQVKVKASGWILISHDWCPYEKWKSEHRDGDPEMPREDWGDAATSRETPKILGKLPVPGKGSQDRFSPGVSGRNPLLTPWFQIFGLQNCFVTVALANESSSQ